MFDFLNVCSIVARMQQFLCMMVNSILKLSFLSEKLLLLASSRAIRDPIFDWAESRGDL